MKLIKKDGRLYDDRDNVAVIISPKYGAGWSTWNNNREDLLFDPDIAEAIVEGNYEKAICIAGDKYPNVFLMGI